MSSLIALPENSTETAVLAPASGAPRPITVRRIRSPHAPQPIAAVVHLNQGDLDAASEDLQLPAGNNAGENRHTAGRTPSVQDRPGEEPVASSRADEARIAAIAASVGKAALEVLGGTRPLNQMARWLDPKSFERLQSRAAMVNSCRRRTSNGAALRLYRSISVRSSRLCQVREGAYEASLVIAEQTRVRAVALRMELQRGSWKITELEIG